MPKYIPTTEERRSRIVLWAMMFFIFLTVVAIWTTPLLPMLGVVFKFFMNFMSTHVSQVVATGVVIFLGLTWISSYCESKGL
jgi:hypothetical protein